MKGIRDLVDRPQYQVLGVLELHFVYRGGGLAGRVGVNGSINQKKSEIARRRNT